MVRQAAQEIRDGLDIQNALKRDKLFRAIGLTGVFSGVYGAFKDLGLSFLGL